MGTEQKCGDLTNTDVHKMGGNISIWDRAKDCCVITHTVVKKMATSPFAYRAKDCCVITDTVVRKTATSPFAHRDQD